jgi:uncharacterized protein YigE (DUF2233 family)
LERLVFILSIYKKFVAKTTILSLLIILASSCASQSWDYVDRDIEILKIRMLNFSYAPIQALFIRSTLTKSSLKVIQANEFGKERMFASDIVDLAKVGMAINANYFDESGKALGLAISRGLLFQTAHHSGNTLTGVFYVDKNGPHITHRDSFKSEGVTEAVQAGPRLLTKGQPILFKENGNRSRRSGVCIDNKKRVVFFLVNAWPFGVSFTELQGILTGKEISCVDALNFDGGGSSQLAVKVAGTSSSQVDLRGSDPVPVFVTLK